MFLRNSQKFIKMHSNLESLTAPDKAAGVEVHVSVPVVDRLVGDDGEGMVAGLDGLARGHRPARA